MNDRIKNIKIQHNFQIGRKKNQGRNKSPHSQQDASETYINAKLEIPNLDSYSNKEHEKCRNLFMNNNE